MKDILESYSTAELKRLVRGANITNYSKLKKAELIELMMRPEYIERFKEIQPKSKREAPDATKKAQTAKSRLNKELKKK